MGFGAVIALAIAVAALAPSGVAQADRFRLSPQAVVEVCFTPEEDCTGLIARRLGAARASLLVQAYRLSARPIVDALLAARRRGVDVRVLLDRSDRGSHGVAALAAAGVPVALVEQVRIAHDKVFIIDGASVITGSLNATAGARRNAENVLIIEDTVLAQRYAANWQRRHRTSSPLPPASSVQ